MTEFDLLLILKIMLLFSLINVPLFLTVLTGTVFAVEDTLCAITFKSVRKLYIFSDQ